MYQRAKEGCVSGEEGGVTPTTCPNCHKWWCIVACADVSSILDLLDRELREAGE